MDIFVWLVEFISVYRKNHACKSELIQGNYLMLKKAVISIFSTLLIAVGAPLYGQAAAIQTATIPLKPAPRVSCRRVIVVDYATGKVLYAKNALERCTIASLQKMLTALCVQDRGYTSKKLTVAASDTKVVPSKLYLKAGHSYPRSTLLKALLVKSGNDAARALARDAAGSQAKFAVMMNKKAKAIGMARSNFINPHGLTAAGQYSCAYDAAIMARVAYHNKTLRSYMGTKQYTFTYADGRKKLFNNTNKILKNLNYCNGLKTGTTNASGRCLASSGTLNGRTVIAVCLGGDGVSVWKDSTSLLRWALERPAATR